MSVIEASAQPLAERQHLSPQSLLLAYPDELVGIDATSLIWRDGTRMPLSDDQPGKSFEQMLRNGSILDQLSIPYPKGPLAALPPLNDDPGRIRNRAFFDKMYGDCTKGEVAPHLVRVDWLPHSWGHTVSVTAINGVDQALRAISDELDALPDAEKKYVYPPAGAYNCRAVHDTGEPSMHSYGAAIDINTRTTTTWLWHRDWQADAATLPHVPDDIVAIFERHGFIWGGKWSHYDTMHFEYRPELLGERQ